MDEDDAIRLFDKALECRKLAWSLSDPRSQLVLHEIATAYEASAQQKIDERAPAIPWPDMKARGRDKDAARRAIHAPPRHCVD